MWFDCGLNRKGDAPGWAYIVGIILALAALAVIAWIAFKSGQFGSGLLGGLK